MSLLFACAAFLLAGAADGAPPALSHLYPVAGQQGTTTSVTATGKFDPWPPQVWIDGPGITFKPAKDKGKFDVEIAPDAIAGPRLIRFFNEQGASGLRFFIVSRLPEWRDAEPNDDWNSPQKVTGLPGAISGRLDKSGDVDCFAVTLKKGQTLVAWVEAYVLGSTFDGLLRIVNTEGIQLAFNHDGRTLDPFLAWEAPCDGTFIVQVMGFVHPASSNVQLTGGDGCVYRLHLTAGPFVRYTLPLAAQRGKKAPVQLVGWNLPCAQAELDATQLDTRIAAELPLPGALADQPLAISDVSEATENEPNDTPGVAQALDIPGAVTSRINRANDEDRYTFAAVKQRSYQFKLTAAGVGSPLDAWLKIEGKDGKELARSDDADGSRDPQLTWTAPSDAPAIVAVGDLTHRGGDDFVYRLAITEAAPSVTGTVASDLLSVAGGKTSDIKVTIKRANGFKQKLQLAAKDLPNGVTAPAVDVPEKAGDATLKLVAESGASAASQPLVLILRETESGAEHPVRYVITGPLDTKGGPNSYTDLVIGSTDQLWLTVSAEPAKSAPSK